MNTTKQPIYKVAKDTAFVFVSMLLTSLLQFAVGIVVIRSVSQSEYGLISLAMVIITLLVTISTIGFNNGLPRFLAMLKVKQQSNDFKQLAIYSLIFCSLVSTILWFILYTNASLIAVILKKNGLEEILSILSLTLPPMTIIFLLTAIFRGYENVIPKIFFQDISINLIKLVLLIIALFLGLKIKFILWFYVFPVWCSLIFYLIYSYNKKLFNISINYNREMMNKLITFSFPLLCVTLLGDFIEWSGTLILGFFHSASDVGLYNAPRRFTAFISMPLMAANFVYLPLATKVYLQKDKNALISLYQKSTKWIFILTLPLLLYFILDAEYVVSIGLGEEYLISGDILRLLSLGFSIHNFLGLNGITLMSCGKNRIILLASGISSIVFIIFSFLLVPKHGAIASAWSIIISNIIYNIIISFNLFRITGCHPFTFNYIKPIVFSSIMSVFLFMFINPQNTKDWFSHLSLFVMISLFSILSPIITKSLEPDEIELCSRVLKRINIL